MNVSIRKTLKNDFKPYMEDIHSPLVRCWCWNRRPSSTLPPDTRNTVEGLAGNASWNVWPLAMSSWYPRWRGFLWGGGGHDGSYRKRLTPQSKRNSLTNRAGATFACFRFVPNLTFDLGVCAPIRAIPVTVCSNFYASESPFMTCFEKVSGMTHFRRVQRHKTALGDSSRFAACRCTWWICRSRKWTRGREEREKKQKLDTNVILACCVDKGQTR